MACVERLAVAVIAQTYRDIYFGMRRGCHLSPASKSSKNYRSAVESLLDPAMEGWYRLAGLDYKESLHDLAIAIGRLLDK